MSLRFALAAAALGLALAAAAPAAGEIRIAGHGWGHGAGMAQYGARGYAEHEHRSYRWILAHYYRSTALATRPAARLRVRLKQASALRVQSAAVARGRDGRRVALVTGHTYRFTPSGTGALHVADLGGGRVLPTLFVPVRLTAGSVPLRLLGTAENGVQDGRYRGALTLWREGDNVLAVDDVDLEQYLRSVVPSEMPASWPAEALRAQAVAARSYALAAARPAGPFDVFADTRSQMYRGTGAESSRATAAVDATRRLAVVSGGLVALTLFHSSSGGRTAAVEEVLASAPVPYLVSVADPYDRFSPYHDWSVTMSEQDAAQRLGALVPGGVLTGLSVVATTPTGRARSVRITGTPGFQDVDARTVRTLLGLRSTWFTIG